MDANLTYLSIYFAGYLFTFIWYLTCVLNYEENDGRDSAFVAVFWPIVLVLGLLCLVIRRVKRR